MDKTNHTQIKFSRDYSAIIWISAHNLLKKDIVNIAKTIEKHDIFGEDSLYCGACFGRYDFVIDFKIENPRVASSYVWRLQQFIKDKLGDNYDLCSSLTLCREIVSGNAATINSSVEIKIRAYSLVRLKPTGIKNNLEKILETARKLSPSKVLWNSSTYNLILVFDGDSYHELFLRLRRFRHLHRDDLSETCTYFTLKWDFSAMSFVEDSKNSIGIPALVFVKLKDDLNSEFEGLSGWSPIFCNNGGEEILQFRRLGSLDECLGIIKPNLKEIKEAIFDLRNKNPMLNTSTVLLYPAKQDGDFNAR